MDPTKYFIRKTRTYRAACCTYIASIIVLLLMNCWFHLTDQKLTFWELFKNFVAPFLCLSPLYFIVWKHRLLGKLLLNWLPSIKITALFIAAVSSFLMCLFHNSQFANLTTPLLAVWALAMTPYTMVSKKVSATAIIAEGIWFILLSSKLNNAEAVAGIYGTAIVLLYALGKLNWYYSSEQYVYLATRLAVVCFCLIVSVIISFDNPITQAFVGAYWSSPARIVFPAKFDWCVIIPLATLCFSSIYITRKSSRLQHYLAVCCSTLICINSIGYILNYFGWNYLCFTGIAPFISGGFLENFSYLAMSAVILPPKQITSSKNDCAFSEKEIDAVVQQIIENVHSTQNTTTT